ncbi:MAG: trp operon repressor [Simkania sp.]|nr:trp operon repressor [Simkania sp.]
MKKKRDKYTCNGVPLHEDGKESIENGWQGFLELCCKIKAPEDLDRLFGLFLTIEEKEALAARYLIIKALVQGQLTQRKIAEIHQVSIAQITRGSNALKIVGDELYKFLEKQLK